MAKITREEALHYHSCGRPGKIEVIPTKPYNTQFDLSMAYTPGVAEPCLEIQKNPEDAYLYTAKCNLVAVISNGTAVLGLGDIGALAGKPVMEGKGLLFKPYPPPLEASTLRILKPPNALMWRRDLKRNWISRYFMMTSMAPPLSPVPDC
jgi:hypothetical protein